MSLCILAGGKTVVLATAAFTLSWVHSVEKTRWEEDWRVTPAGFEIVEARIKGSGAGIDPPPGSILRNGWWSYRPAIGIQASLRLAASGTTGAGWSLCARERCMTFGAEAGEPVIVTACGQNHCADPNASPECSLLRTATSLYRGANHRGGPL